MRDNSVTRFWSKVEKGDSCWLWRGKLTPFGHGSFKACGRWYFAHRAAWELTVGPIPKGLCLLHKCDVPACVNPAHLAVGTQSDNILDAVRKGRWVQARLNRNRKLTDAQVVDVVAMRAAGASQASIAKKYGLNPSTIHRRLNREYREMQ